MLAISNNNTNCNNKTINILAYNKTDLSHLSDKDFEFIDEQLDECDYILLDDNDRIRFVPNSNVYSADENYPSIVFYAWDQSLQNNSGSCVNFSEQENNECNNSIPISTNAIRAFWKIESVNDPFNIVINK